MSVIIQGLLTDDYVTQGYGVAVDAPPEEPAAESNQTMTLHDWAPQWKHARRRPVQQRVNGEGRVTAPPPSVRGEGSVRKRITGSGHVEAPPASVHGRGKQTHPSIVQSPASTVSGFGAVQQYVDQEDDVLMLGELLV